MVNPFSSVPEIAALNPANSASETVYTISRPLASSFGRLEKDAFQPLSLDNTTVRLSSFLPFFKTETVTLSGLFVASFGSKTHLFSTEKLVLFFFTSVFLFLIFKVMVELLAVSKSVLWIS